MYDVTQSKWKIGKSGWVEGGAVSNLTYFYGTSLLLIWPKSEGGKGEGKCPLVPLVPKALNVLRRSKYQSKRPHSGTKNFGFCETKNGP